MAKAITVVLLLAATAAFAAAHPGLGKGFSGAVVTSDNSTAPAPAPQQATIAVSHPFHHESNTDLSKCDCKDDCQETKRKVCKSRNVPQPDKCEDVEGVERVEVCATKCFKADKIVTIGHGGKGRRLLNAQSMQVAPHIVAAKAVIAHGVLAHSGAQANATTEEGPKQEICREICKPEDKPTTKNVCKKQKPKKEFFDCKEEVTSRRCVKKCNCGEKTVTVSHTPDFGAIVGTVLGHHHG